MFTDGLQGAQTPASPSRSVGSGSDSPARCGAALQTARGCPPSVTSRERDRSGQQAGSAGPGQPCPANTAFPGHRAIKETSFPRGVGRISLSTQISPGLDGVFQGILTGGSKGPAAPFSLGFAARLPERRLTKGLLARPCGSRVFSHAGDKDAVYAPGPISQLCPPWPSTRQLCPAPAARDHSPCSVPPCSGGDGRWLLPLLLPHLQGQHGPAVQIKGA